MVRRRPDLGLLLLLAVLAGCASPPGEVDQAPGLDAELPLREIETHRAARLLEGEPGLAREVTLELSVRPKAPVLLKLIGRRSVHQEFGDGLLEVELRWKDFVGTQPTSFGGSRRLTVPFGDDGEASREQPFLRQWSFDLPQPDSRVLARRVRLKAKLHPVDVRTSGVRSAGRALEFDGVTRDSFLQFSDETPEGGLKGVLAMDNAEPATVFLAAVGAGLDTRDVPVLVGAAVASLEAATGQRRDALFGALQFLTGQVQGRSVARWQLWWSRQPENPMSSESSSGRAADVRPSQRSRERHEST